MRKEMRAFWLPIWLYLSFSFILFFKAENLVAFQFKAKSICILNSFFERYDSQYKLFWHYIFNHFNPTKNYIKIINVNRKKFIGKFPRPSYIMKAMDPIYMSYKQVYNNNGELALTVFNPITMSYLKDDTLQKEKLNIHQFAFRYFFDKNWNIIGIDTLFYPLSLPPTGNVLFPSLIQSNTYYFISNELDTNNRKSYFKIKKFRGSENNDSAFTIEEKRIPNEYFPTINRYCLPNDTSTSLPGPKVFYNLIRGEKQDEWWLIENFYSTPFLSETLEDSILNRSDLYPQIRIFKFVDDSFNNCQIIPWNFVILDTNLNKFWITSISFSSDRSLCAILAENIEEINRKIPPTGMYKRRLYILRFNNKDGNFYPFDGANTVQESFIEFSINLDSIPENILSMPLYDYWWFSWVSDFFVDYSPSLWFSNNSEFIYHGRWQLNLKSKNLDSIKKNIKQWLPNNLTYLDFLNRFDIKSFPSGTYHSFVDFISKFIGLGDTVFSFYFFPTFTGKWYLFTLSYLDSLSPSLSKSMDYSFGKPYFLDSKIHLKCYEIKNLDSSLEKISFEYLWSDTIIPPQLPPNDQDYKVTYDDVIHSSFFRFLSLASSIYFEYFYPPRGVLALGPSEVCEGEEIHLEATMHLYPDTSAQYYWYGPNGWQDTGRSVIIRNAQINNSGKYICKAVFADTTFSSEVYVQVVPRPKITFERAVPRYICNGEPYTVRITFPRWGRQNYWILWSTGDTVEAVTISNSGEYWVKVWDENGCTDSVGFKVEYVETAEVRILKEKEYICTGERIWLEVEEGWDSIQWSTGETSRRIYVERGGNYRVEVRNRFGCVAQGETTVEEVNLELELPNLVDFGKVHLWTTEERRVGIVNTSGSRITGSINYVGSEEIEVEPRGRFAIDVGDSIEIVGKCSAKGYGLKEGKVLVEVDSPCVKIWEIEMQGRGTGVVKVWTIDSVVVVGEKDFCIPIYSKVEVGGEDTVMGWQGEVVFERGLMATGEGSIVGEERVVKFNGEVKMDTMVKEIGRICGDILLPERRVVAIDLRGFEFGENYEVNEEDGRLRVIGVCEPELSQVEIRNVLRLTIIPNPAGEKFKFRIEGERWKEYKIRINDLLGKSIEEVEGKFEGSEVEIEFEGKELGKGMFFGQLCSGGECVIQAFWIW